MSCTAELLLILSGLVLILTGLIIVFSATLLSSKKSNVRSGGIILVGPFPVLIFGKNFKPLAILFLALLIIFSLFILITVL